MAEKYGTIPKDFKGRLGYFWDYYKWHTIVTLCVLILLAVTITQCATRVDPDYSVLLSISKTVPGEYVDQIENYLAKYGKDINGDGQVSVQIIDVSVSSSDPNPQMVAAQKTKLQAELAVGNAILFITDEEQFEYLDTQIGLFQKLDFLKAKDSKAYNWNGSAFENAINTDGFFPKDLYFSMRVIKGSAAEKTNKKSVDYEAAAKALLKKLAEDSDSAASQPQTNSQAE